MGNVKDGKITLKSFHNKFVSAQPNGSWQVNRDKALQWEYITIEHCGGGAVAPPAASPSANTTGKQICVAVKHNNLKQHKYTHILI